MKEPANRHQGFVDRIPNPIAEVKSYDPRPECFVALEGGPAAADASAPSPRPVTWALQRPAFYLYGTAADAASAGALLAGLRAQLAA